jgi:uncharacterized protein YllA (UPF0747 family)
LKFRDLPGFPPLYADFVEGSEALREFYPWPPDAHSLQERVQGMATDAGSRNALCDLIAGQAERFRCSAASFSHIDLFRDPGCVVIAASVRPEPMGGMLSSWLKIVTAARLAHWLKAGGTPAVALIWICADIASDSRAADISSPLSSRQIDPADRPASHRDPPGSANGSLLADLEDHDIQGRLKEAYAPGMDRITSWARLISGLFESLGVLLLDPREAELDPLYRHPEKNIGIKEFLDADADGARRLTARGYALQKSRAMRAAIDKTSYPAGEWPKHEIRALGKAAPFVAQSLLLPVAAHVLDEEDSILFARSSAMFELYSVFPPLAWPRASATILDLRSRRLLNRYGLSLTDLFAGAENLSGRILERLGAQDVLREFDDLRSGIEKYFSELAQFAPSGHRLSIELGESRKRIFFQIGKLRQRFHDARQRKIDTVNRHAARLCRLLAPHGRLQEMESTGIALMSKVSRNLPQVLADRVNPWEFEHQLIDLE